MRWIVAAFAVLLAASVDAAENPCTKMDTAAERSSCDAWLAEYRANPCRLIRGEFADPAACDAKPPVVTPQPIRSMNSAEAEQELNRILAEANHARWKNVDPTNNRDHPWWSCRYGVGQLIGLTKIEAEQLCGVRFLYRNQMAWRTRTVTVYKYPIMDHYVGVVLLVEGGKIVAAYDGY